MINKAIYKIIQKGDKYYTDDGKELPIGNKYKGQKGDKGDSGDNGMPDYSIVWANAIYAGMGSF